MIVRQRETLEEIHRIVSKEASGRLAKVDFYDGGVLLQPQFWHYRHIYEKMFWVAPKHILRNGRNFTVLFVKGVFSVCFVYLCRSMWPPAAQDRPMAGVTQRMNG